METPSAQIGHTVEFAETDAAGLVHFSNFFRYVEKAERTLFEQLDLPLFVARGDSLGGFPRVEASCRYLRPVAFGDRLRVDLFLRQVRASALHYSFRCFRTSLPGQMASATDAKEPEPVAEGRMVTVFSRRDAVTGAISAQLLPDEWREKLLPLVRPEDPA